MKEEDEIRRMCGTKNPFTVPEGYFEDFTTRLMDQLPATPKPVTTPDSKASMWQRVKPWICVAAAACGLIWGFATLTNSHDAEEVVFSESRLSAARSDEYIDAVIDNSMMDDYLIYCYLTEPDNESN